jgi:arylsulfatase
MSDGKEQPNILGDNLVVTGFHALSGERFIYFDDDGDLVALRFDNWKVVFMEQRCAGTLQVWAEPFVPLRMPKIFKQFPPRQKAATFTIDQAMERLEAGLSGAGH